MPGPYAQAMLAEQRNSRFPKQMLSIMLYSEDMQALDGMHLDAQVYDMITHLDVTSSCHPDAGRFMNIISNANFLNDLPADTSMKTGGAAAALITQAQIAANQDNKAIWVKYGNHEEHSHSTMLFTGSAEPCEHFEAWALRGGGMPFHECICDYVDALQCNRAEAIQALGDLISDNPDERERGWNMLSRAGGDYAPKQDEAVNVGIWIADQRNLGTFTNQVRQRMRNGSYYAARAHENVRRLWMCCRCQWTKWIWTTAIGWITCSACARRYCWMCKKLLNGTCDCGHAPV